MNTIHSNSAAAAACPDDAGGLRPVLLVAKSYAHFKPVATGRLCNDAAGTVRYIPYQTEHKPPDMPTDVLVDYISYAGPQC